MIESFNNYIPTELIFGCGCVKQLASLPALGKKALIVMSSGKSIRKYGYLDKVTSALDAQNIEWRVYDKILPNPINLGISSLSNKICSGLSPIYI